MNNQKKIEDMSLSELKGLKAKFAAMPPEEITPEQRQGLVELDLLIMDKITDEKVRALGKTQSFVQKSKAADEKARKLWPDLNDPDSEFAKQVEQYLEESGDGETNPNALLNAANAVGLERGEVPSTLTTKAPKIGATKGGDDEDSGEQDEQAADFLERTKNIQHKFRDLINMDDPDTRARIVQYSQEGED
jgi:hypothetical protein